MFHGVLKDRRPFAPGAGAEAIVPEIIHNALPLEISTVGDGTGHIFADLTDTYIGQTPTVKMTLTDTAPVFTYMMANWNVCNELTGYGGFYPVGIFIGQITNCSAGEPAIFKRTEVAEVRNFIFHQF